MHAGGKHPRDIISEKKLARLTDEKELAAVIRRVMRDHPGPLRQYQEGKTRTFAFFMGRLMDETGGQADPGIAAALLKKLLKGENGDEAI
jgi:aspartyl-tRNA(Asn)/glutamyl-tRNA(Gln) amidotransferase subunit B